MRGLFVGPTLTQVSDGEGPVDQVWYCSKAEFCNWTNNPTMVGKDWWHNEYELKFPVRCAVQFAAQHSPVSGTLRHGFPSHLSHCLFCQTCGHACESAVRLLRSMWLAWRRAVMCGANAAGHWRVQ